MARKKLEITLTQKQSEFLAASRQYPVIFFGGAKGGGKSHGLRTIILMRCLEVPGTTAVIFRRTYKELESNHITRVKKDYPQFAKGMNKANHTLTLPNGSTIEFRHCARTDDVHLYQGCEYDIVGIDEVGQWPEQMFQTIRGSNRTSKPGFRPVTLLTGNPGGIGHKWLKRIFIQKDLNERERDQDYHFIQSRVYDNPALMDNDPDYVHRLEAEPNEALRKAYLHGDWDIFAGQFFGEFRREIHVVPPFDIPKHWLKFGAFDPGYAHPASFGWYAADETGRVYKYREMLERGLRIDQLAERLHQYPDTKELRNIQAGRDCWAHGRDGSPTIAEQFQKLPAHLRLNLTPANVDRIQGATLMRQYLAWQDIPEGMPKGPRYMIFDNCRHTINCISSMIHDPNRPEDVLKVDATDDDPFCGDDAYDTDRMFIMSRPRQTKVEMPFVIKTYEQRVKNWQEKRRKQIARKISGQVGDNVLGNKW